MASTLPSRNMQWMFAYNCGVGLHWIEFLFVSRAREISLLWIYSLIALKHNTVYNEDGGSMLLIIVRVYCIQ